MHVSGVTIKCSPHVHVLGVTVKLGLLLLLVLGHDRLQLVDVGAGQVGHLHTGRHS